MESVEQAQLEARVIAISCKAMYTLSACHEVQGEL